MPITVPPTLPFTFASAQIGNVQQIPFQLGEGFAGRVLLRYSNTSNNRAAVLNLSLFSNGFPYPAGAIFQIEQMRGENVGWDGGYSSGTPVEPLFPSFVSGSPLGNVPREGALAGFRSLPLYGVAVPISGTRNGNLLVGNSTPVPLEIDVSFHPGTIQRFFLPVNVQFNDGSDVLTPALLRIPDFAVGVKIDFTCDPSIETDRLNFRYGFTSANGTLFTGSLNNNPTIDTRTIAIPPGGLQLVLDPSRIGGAGIDTVQCSVTWECAI